MLSSAMGFTRSTCKGVVHHLEQRTLASSLGSTMLISSVACVRRHLIRVTCGHTPLFPTTTTGAIRQPKLTKTTAPLPEIPPPTPPPAHRAPFVASLLYNFFRYHLTLVLRRFTAVLLLPLFRVMTKHVTFLQHNFYRPCRSWCRGRGEKAGA